MGSADAPTELRRSLTFPWLLLYGLGTTVGAGIYALTGLVAGRAGLLAPLAFVAASLLALFTALSFAELGSRFPRAGGAAVYVLEGFRVPALGTAVGLLVVAAGLISSAAGAVALAGHLESLLGLPRLPVTIAVVLAIAVVAVWGVRESVSVAGLITLVEVGGLLAVIVAGRAHFAELPERIAEFVPRDFAAWQAIGAAALLCFYAFIGFEDMANVAEEVKQARRVLPRAIVATLIVTLVLYVLLATVAVLAVPAEELAASQAPLALVFERCGGRPGVLGGIAVAALVNGVLIQVLMASRVCYGLAREGQLPAWLGRVHPRRRTPWLATLLCAAGVLVLASAGRLEALAEATSLVTLLAFAFVNAALLRVRFRETAPPAGATVYPIAVPGIGCAASLALLAFRATS